MSFDIQLTDLTDSTTATDGTGVFDVLTNSVVRHIESQYNEGRLVGTDYANVYLGSMQSILAESVRFVLQEKQSGEQAALIAQQVLSETKNNEVGGVIDQQKRKLQEEIDLVVAQTAGQYEQIKSSKEDTLRKNLLNSREVLHKERETALVERQESELELNGIKERLFTAEKTASTADGRRDNTLKTNADVALTNAQEIKVKAETELVESQNVEIPLKGASERSVDTAQVAKLGSEKLLVDSQNAEVAANALSQREINTAQTSKLTSDKFLVDAQTAEVASNALSQRSVDTAQISKISSEKTLVDSQNAEVALNAASQRDINTAQIDKLSSEKILVDSQNAEISPNAVSQRAVDTSQIAKLSSESTLLDSRNAETLANTIRTDSESAQRVLLMQAQTTGFKTDAKQKLMRQLYEGYAVNVTTAGEVTASPTGAGAASLDAVANDILDDLGSTVNI